VHGLFLAGGRWEVGGGRWLAGGASGLVLCLLVIFFAAISTGSRGRAGDPFKSEIAIGIGGKAGLGCK
jgi:hypothetical protein